MSNTHKSDHDPNIDPNIDQTPIHTGNKPDTLADRENVVFRYPEWVTDRISATALMLVLLTILIGVGSFALWFVMNGRLW